MSFEMTATEMKDLGIQAFSHRKRLLRVIVSHQAGRNTASASMEQPHEQVQSQSLRARQEVFRFANPLPRANEVGNLTRQEVASAASSTDSTLAVETQRRLHLGEAEKSRCFFIVCAAVIIMQHYITLTKCTKLR